MCAQPCFGLKNNATIAIEISAASKIGFSVQSLEFLKQYQIKLILINVYVSVMLGSTLKSYFRRGAAQMCCLYSPMIRKTNLKCRHQFKSSFSKTSDASLLRPKFYNFSVWQFM